jgi:hypothetical protein
MESGDQPESEDDGMREFCPAEPANRQGLLALEKPRHAPNQQWQESERGERRDKREAPRENQSRRQQYLSGKDTSSDLEFLRPTAGPGGAKAELHKMNLVAGKQQVRHPQCPRIAVEASHHHAVCRRRRNRQAERGNNLR